MRFVPCVLVMALLWLGTAGCASFGKKSSTGDRPPGADAAKGQAKNPAPFDPILGTPGSTPVPPPAPTARASSSGAILAGRVIDPFDHSPGPAYVRWVCVEDNKESASPIDVAVNPDGYFTIMGLKPGSSYKLIARAKNGDKMLAGVTYTAAPNIRVLIQVKENLASADTPQLPGSPAFQSQGTATSPKTSNDNPASTGNGKETSLAPLGNKLMPGAEPDLPIPVKVPMPDQGVSAPHSVPNWMPGNPDANKTWPPTLEISGPRPKPAFEMQQPLPLPPSEGVPPPPVFPGTQPVPPPLTRGPNIEGGPARVPSCVLVGKQLVNFALNDINGEPWEFRTQHRGKLVLLDFWATYCIPCRETMPKIRALQTRFSGQGLEIVGIAYESGGTAQEQGYRVNSLCQRLQVNYRQLLGGGPTCPVKTQLNIQYVPTLVLVDEQGWILWRHEGQPDRAVFDELERLIQTRLSSRPF